MKLIQKILVFTLLGFFAVVVAFDIWGAMTLGHITPSIDASRDANANKVVMVLGATGSVGDGLLKAAMEDAEVDQVFVLSRRVSPRIEKGLRLAAFRALRVEEHFDLGTLHGWQHGSSSKTVGKTASPQALAALPTAP